MFHEILTANVHMYKIVWYSCGRHCLPLQNLMRGRKAQVTTEPQCNLQIVMCWSTFTVLNF